MLNYFSVVIFFIISSNLMAQANVFDDSTVVFKNTDGKILTVEEAKSIITNKGPVKLLQKTDQESGNKTVVIVPMDSLEVKRIAEEKERRVNRLKNKPFTGFNFTDARGQQFNTKLLSGKLVVVNFWFISCKPCIEEMPALNLLVKDYEPKGVLFIAPCNDQILEINKFLEKHKFDYVVIPNAATFSEKLGVEVYPTHLIVDKE
ncbi:TlpA family protein disulfide reductase, partial [bacterium]|nr:TlpA family protein disulfide reductase [bacterium]